MNGSMLANYFVCVCVCTCVQHKCVKDIEYAVLIHTLSIVPGPGEAGDAPPKQLPQNTPIS